MTSSFAFAYWGDNDFMDKSLKMYMETADPVHGIAHSYARDMSQKETGLVAEQGFYINFLYQYYLNGGNIKPYYDFAKMLFDIILQSEVKNTGLCILCGARHAGHGKIYRRYRYVSPRKIICR